MESTIVLESVANRTDYSPENSLNWRTEIDRQQRIGDDPVLFKKSVERKARNERRVMTMLYQTRMNDMRVDEGMCLMIDDLLDGDMHRFMQLCDQVDLLVYRQIHVRVYTHNKLSNKNLE